MFDSERMPVDCIVRERSVALSNAGKLAIRSIYPPPPLLCTAYRKGLILGQKGQDLL